MVYSLLCLLFLTAVLHTVSAAKILPRFKNAVRPVSSSGSPGVSVKLRLDRQALLVYFSNLNKARSVSYTLSYQTNGREEGVAGSIDPLSGNSASRSLDFGTCSSGVCRYHANITNMKLEVTIELVSGKKLLRRFRVKV